jgi:hypothetical protein
MLPKKMYAVKNYVFLRWFILMTNLFKFLESSLRLTLKMASGVGDPDALDGFIGLG